MHVLLVDNYDSFAYNLVQALRVLGARVDVVRNDVADVAALLRRGADRIVVSPGPCTPKEAGVSTELCRKSGVPLLGVCLGHQCLVEAFGGVVGRAQRVRHGKTSPIAHDGRGLFTGLPSPMTAARYHSLIATKLPDCLELSAWTDGRREPMAVRHRERPLFGVQFHPESFLTPEGNAVLRNFLESSPT
ncbi:MAG: aminodeoxychorismate/anthranilate synthase component II [Planctomycetota bacterium]|nr:aminodeoxychorismate/anthranilate synthase component II [Planctomycetota bacterium]